MPAIAALAFISALTIDPATILPDSTKPTSKTLPASFFVNNLGLPSVLKATSPTTKSLADGLFPEPLFNLIVFAI